MKYDEETIPRPDLAVAVVGMAARLPGAQSVDEFWRNLSDGVESIRRFSDEELLASGVPRSDFQDPAYVRAMGVVDDVEAFDAALFGFSPRDAELMDPQHRLVLECALEALEDAGHDPYRYGDRIGVFCGVGTNTYFLNHLNPRQDLMKSVGSLRATGASAKDYVSTRVSYRLDLRGPSLSVQTACSTSLVAVHFACQSLLGGECEMALAGGASIRVPQRCGYFYEEGGIASPDGHCRAFDAGAAGTVGGNGAAVVLLKPLALALADRDPVRAIILGSAVNNDGSEKIGFTAPSVKGQASVVVEALEVAGVDARTITNVEAHGTGTSLGDPIEIGALTKAFRTFTEERGFCSVGSVKTNIGHLDAAAGAAGFIKAALCVQKGELVPSINYRRSNPEIDFDGSPFRVNRTRVDWKPRDFPRRCGVSSFGIGGTNAHVVIQEPPPTDPSPPPKPWNLLILSAKTPSALDVSTKRLAAALREKTDLNLSDVAWTLQVGRAEREHRRFVVCRDPEQAVSHLTGSKTRHGLSPDGRLGEPAVFFLFPGQGSQHLGMARGCFEGERVYRQSLERCHSILSERSGIDLLSVLDPSRDASDPAIERLNRTSLTQPALFAVEYALAQLWRSWGVKPHAMIGHSVGEYVAACLAGVFSLDDALGLLTVRGRLIEQLPSGAMVAVQGTQEELAEQLEDGLAIAAVNAPTLCTVSGPFESIDAFESRMSSRGVFCRRLRTSHAFHSAMMDPILDAFAREVSRVELRSPVAPYISNLTGTWADADQVVDPHYWARHIREPVRFAEGLQTLADHAAGLALEVGPGRALSTFVSRSEAVGDRMESIPSLGHGLDETEDAVHLLNALGRLWSAGVPIEWAGLYPDGVPRRVSLPTYPFERKRFWVEPPGKGTGQVGSSGVLFPSWNRGPLLRLDETARSLRRGSWLLFVQEHGFGQIVAKRLQELGIESSVVIAGSSWREIERPTSRGRTYEIRPDQREDYRDLVQTLRRRGSVPSRILHLWSVGDGERGEERSELTGLREGKRLGMHSLIFLVQALGDLQLAEETSLLFVTSRAKSVSGRREVFPERALAFGVVKTIAQEFPGLQCQSLDVDEESVGEGTLGLQADSLIVELDRGVPSEPIAYRGLYRWRECFEAGELMTVGSAPLFRDGGVYLVTGGLGGMGLAIAEEIASRAKVNLALLGRRPFPAKEIWRSYRERREDDETAVAIQTLLRIEASGSNVEVYETDVADRESLSETLERVEGKQGGIRGVVHAAGIAGGGTLREWSEEKSDRVLRPKVEGTLLIRELVDASGLDFFVCCSSLRSLVGGIGEADYASANCFLDALARPARSVEEAPLIAINWDNWLETGMSFRANARDDDASAQVGEGLTTREGRQIFSRVVASPYPSVAVTTSSLGALQERVDRESRGEPTQGERSERAEIADSREAQAVPQASEVEGVLARIWADLLGHESVGLHENLFELGGDSLTCIQICSRARSIGLTVSPNQIFQHPTVKELAERVVPTEAVAEPPSVSVRGAVQLSPMDLWLLDQEFDDIRHFAQARLLEVPKKLSEYLGAVVEKLLEHHDALRLRLVRGASGWSKSIGKGTDVDGFTVVQIEREEELSSAVANEIQRYRRTVDLAQGPIVRFVLLSSESGRTDRLLILAHHISIDVFSWEVLLDDLETGCRQCLLGHAIRFPPKTTSVQEWGRALQRLADRSDLPGLLSGWLGDRWDRGVRLPRDFHRGPNNLGLRNEVRARLGGEATRTLVRETGARPGWTMQSFLLAALAQFLVRWAAGEGSIQIDVEGHGREPLEEGADVSRTIGWFTAVYPVCIEIGGREGLEAIAQEVAREEAEIPLGGIPYGVARFSGGPSEVGDRLSQIPEREVGFLYLGTSGADSSEGVFQPASEEADLLVSPGMKRPYLFDVTCRILGGELEVVWGYSESVHRRASVETLLHRFFEGIQSFVDGLDPEADQTTPLDLSLAKLSQDELEKLVRGFENEER